MTLSPEQRSQRGRIGAYAQKARHDPRETTRRARETFLGRFEIEVDPDQQLPEPERLRRAEAARKRYFLALALKSSTARAARKAARP